MLVRMKQPDLDMKLYGTVFIAYVTFYKLHYDDKDIYLSNLIN